jgi:hypothetical protein
LGVGVGMGWGFGWGGRGVKRGLGFGGRLNGCWPRVLEYMHPLHPTCLFSDCTTNNDTNMAAHSSQVPALVYASTSLLHG